MSKLIKISKLDHILFILICIYNIKSVCCEMKFSFTMSRHGARAPEYSFNQIGEDILGEKWESPGELTSVGIRMQYLLGVRNRGRYQNLLSKSYNPLEIYIKSSDYNRTIMSAMSQLHGLYPPSTGPSILKEQLSKAVPPINMTAYESEINSLGSFSLPGQAQVFPIHLFEKNDEKNFFFYNYFKCKPFGGMMKLIVESNKLKELLKNFNSTWGESLFRALNIKDPNYFYNYMNTFILADAFTADYTDSRRLEKLINAGIDLDKFSETAVEISKFAMFELFNGDSEKIFAKITMSSILEDLFSWMDGKIKNDRNSPKLVMFSVHDVTLASAELVVAKAFDVDKIFPIPYASSIYFDLYSVNDKNETHSKNENDYIVEAYYNDNKLVSISYSEFKNKLKPLILTNSQISEFCGWNGNNLKNNNKTNNITSNSNNERLNEKYYLTTVILTLLVIIITIAFLTTLIVLCCKNRKVQLVEEYPLHDKHSQI